MFSGGDVRKNLLQENYFMQIPWGKVLFFMGNCGCFTAYRARPLKNIGCFLNYTAIPLLPLQHKLSDGSFSAEIAAELSIVIGFNLRSAIADIVKILLWLPFSF